MTSTSVLSFEVEDRVATITLNKPDKGNAICPQMMLDLEQAWIRVQTDPEIRVAIITGAGERHFCTGSDVSALKQGMGGLNNRQYHEDNRFSPRMIHVTKPVICVVNGLVNGGGLHFQSWEWLELSACTIPANASANITTVKALYADPAATGTQGKAQEHTAPAAPGKASGVPEKAKTVKLSPQSKALSNERPRNTVRINQQKD